MSPWSVPLCGDDSRLSLAKDERKLRPELMPRTYRPVLPTDGATALCVCVCVRRADCDMGLWVQCECLAILSLQYSPEGAAAPKGVHRREEVEQAEGCYDRSCASRNMIGRHELHQGTLLIVVVWCLLTQQDDRAALKLCFATCRMLITTVMCVIHCHALEKQVCLSP